VDIGGEIVGAVALVVLGVIILVRALRPGEEA
jgi:cell division septation protein DedD